MIKIAMGQGTQEDVAEEVRKGFVNAMRGGDTLCLDVDQTKPNFREISREGIFIADDFFNFAWLAERENYLQYVREEENHGIGGINPGVGYTRSADFGGVIRSAAESEELL